MQMALWPNVRLDNKFTTCDAYNNKSLNAIDLLTLIHVKNLLLVSNDLTGKRWTHQ